MSVAVRIAVAFVLGGVIGMERGMKHRPAGLRTYMLVCIGSCMIMLTNQYIYQVFGSGDPVRMGAQVVSGIGFLGAGTIVVTKHSQIKGLTTAAGLWAAAAVGLATGIGFYEAAVTGALVIFIILTILGHLDHKMHAKGRYTDVYVELSNKISLGMFMNEVREAGMSVEDVQSDRPGMTDDGIRSFVVTLKARKRTDHTQVFQKINAISGVVYLEII